MQVKCEYCDSYIDDNEEACPSCGAVNPNYNRHANMAPKTIEELKQWYTDHNLPPEETTRFFIGKDIKEAKAFGIYKDDASGKFIVYKNKSDGTRAIRYEGKDEAYAVNELYLKLKDEIQSQKNNNRSAQKTGSVISGDTRNKNTKSNRIATFAIVLVIMIVLYFMGTSSGTNDGYYRRDDQLYLKSGSDWFGYTGDDWISYSTDPISPDDYEDYKVDDYSIPAEEQFESSRFYEENFADKDSDSFWDSWDSDSSWDSSDSWDSGGSDFDSDW